MPRDKRIFTPEEQPYVAQFTNLWMQEMAETDKSRTYGVRNFGQELESAGHDWKLVGRWCTLGLTLASGKITVERF
jgi:hypothetical protein